VNATPAQAEAFGPYAVALTPEETNAAAARYGLRLALGDGLTLRHHAPLAAFILALVFAAILGFTDLISRRAAEIAILVAAAAFMIQRMSAHWRLRNARRRGEAALGGANEPFTLRFDESGATVERPAGARRYPYADLAEAEDAGGLLYLWPRDGAPIVLPAHALADGEAARLIARAKRGIAAGR